MRSVDTFCVVVVAASAVVVSAAPVANTNSDIFLSTTGPKASAALEGNHIDIIEKKEDDAPDARPDTILVPANDLIEKQKQEQPADEEDDLGLRRLRKRHGGDSIFRCTIS